MSRPTLYGHPFSPHVHAVAFALVEKDIGYRTARVEDAPTMSPTMEPLSACISGPGEPILNHQGHFIGGSETALRYIDDAFSGPSLMPAGAIAKARVNRALEIIYREAVSTLGARFANRRIVAIIEGTALGEVDPEMLRAAKDTRLSLESLLRNDPYFGGETLSLADISLATLVNPLMKGPDGRDAVPPSCLLRAWWTRASSRTSFALTASGVESAAEALRTV